MIIILFLTCIISTFAKWSSKQNKAHEIAEIARSMGLPEDDPIIVRAQEIWLEEHNKEKEFQNYNFSQEDINALAKTVWGEARGISSKAEQAAVVWCILNRFDSSNANSIIDIICAPNQFHGYNSKNPVTKELEELVKDVLSRWMREKNGELDVGRTLPKDYLYFSGRNGRNWFKKEYESRTYWDWSLPDPYK